MVQTPEGLEGQVFGGSRIANDANDPDVDLALVLAEKRLEGFDFARRESLQHVHPAPLCMLTGFSNKGYILKPMMLRLRGLTGRDADALDEGSEANVGAERVEAGVNLDIGKTFVADLEGAFEPFKRLVVFLKTCIDQRDFIAADSGSVDVLF